MIVREPNCAACPLSRDGKKPDRAVPGVGDLYEPDLVIVGEGPGQEEEIHKEPFVGKSGKLLDEGIERAGGKRSRMWITNAAMCRPPRGASVELRQQAAECCWPRLESELNCSASSNVPVIAFGRVSAEVIKKDKVDVVADSGTAFSWNGRTVVASLHPAFILRQIGTAKHPDGMLWALTAHIQNALAVARGEPMVELKRGDISYYLEPTEAALADLSALYEEAKEFGFVAVDTETHSKLSKPYDARHPVAAVIDMIGFATPKRAVAVTYPSQLLQPIISAILADPDIAKVCHNLPYDLAVMRQHGFVFGGVLEDTLLQHHALFPGAKHALQHAATYHQVAHRWKSEYRDKSDGIEDRAVYNAYDTLSTGRMHRKQKPLLAELGVKEMYENDIFNAKLAARMTLVGMPVDRDENERLRQIFQKKIDEHKERVEARLEGFGSELWRLVAAEQALKMRKEDSKEYVERVEKRYQELEKLLSKGKLKWKHKSAAHMGAYCQLVGHPITVRTEKGQLSTAGEVLRELAAKSPEIASIRVLLENGQNMATFVTPIFDREIVMPSGKIKLKRGWAINGRVHPVWSVNKLPGRWGSAWPTVMNIPKEDMRRGRPNLRTQYKSLPGRVQVGFDYQALHPRIIAALSGDTFLMKVFREGRDLHGELSGEVWAEYKGMKCPEPCEICKAAWEKGEQNKGTCHGKQRCQPKCPYCSGDHAKLKMCVRKKRMRDSIKAPEYTWFYRGTLYTAWLQACDETPGLPISNVERMFDGMKRAMTGVWAWQERILRGVEKPPYEVRDAKGWRRLTFQLGQPQPSDAVNFPVLATETLLVHAGLRKMAPLLKKYKYAETIHYGSDAITYEVNEDEADELMVDVRNSFEMEWRGVPFPIEIAKGQSFAET